VGIFRRAVVSRVTSGEQSADVDQHSPDDSEFLSLAVNARWLVYSSVVFRR